MQLRYKMAPIHAVLRLRVDVLELLGVWMLAPSTTCSAPASCNRGRAASFVTILSLIAVPHEQLDGQRARALARPAQWRFRASRSE
jgi:hypothetical protein